MNLMRRLTVLPLMIFVAILAFSVRLADIYTTISASTGAAMAEEAAHDDPLASMPKAAIPAAHDEDKKAENDHGSGKEPALKIEEDPEEESEEEEINTVFDDDVSPKKWRDASDEDLGFSSTKIEIAEDLVERRKELDQREKELKTREALLKATELELDRKVQELNGLRKKIESLLDKQSEEEQARIQSLVKIYEGMKAKEAAAIFDTLDLDILVTVMSSMSERRLAPILAKMNPERARTVTIMMAEQKQLPTLPQR